MFNIYIGGYQSRANEFCKQIRDNANQMEQSRLEFMSFSGLKVNEDRAIEKRIRSLEDDVQRQNDREKQLQQQYDQLSRQREELTEKLNKLTNSQSVG